MGLYEDRVLPHLVNVVCGAPNMRKLRVQACEGLHGDIVEIGFGSGLNVPVYPHEVTSVVAVEPSDVAWQIASKRVADSPVPVVRSGLDGARLPFDDNSFDCALSTWTMCTIPDLPRALAELRRVLRPGGTLHFVEHGLAPDESVQKWQYRLDPIQNRVAGGCHLSRPVVQSLRDAGFEIEGVDEFYGKGAPRFAVYFSVGRAVSN